MASTKVKMTFKDIRLAQEELNFKIQNLLFKQGWEFTPEDNTGGVYLWKKKFKGKTYLVNESTAIYICEYGGK